MLDYPEGFYHLKFDAEKYDFQSLMLSGLNEYATGLGETTAAESLTELHKLPKIQANVEQYRQAAFSIFRTEAFQTMFKAFGADLLDTYFGGVGLIQKTPTVRIQLPDATSTSYHSDGWYGHGASVRSFWLPLTAVSKGNTLYMAEGIETSLGAIEEILNVKASLAEINEIGRKVCTPFSGEFGDMLSFSSKMIHGAEANELDYTRVSFDFRIAPDENDLGSKPRSNFFSREELNDLGAARNEEIKGQESLCGITYSNLCGGKSAKAQLLLCSAYAEINKIDVIGNEAEIIALDYMPVMRNYLLEDNAATNCIIVFGVDVFEGNLDLAKQIMDCADQGGRKIVFCAEGITYGDETVNREDVLGYMSTNSF